MVDSPRVNRPFESTRRWHRMLNRFSEEVPLNANRYYFRSIPNSFSGRAAADTMQFVLAEVFPERNTEREHARKLLDKLLDQSLIVVVANQSSGAFRDEKDTYYRFGESMPKEAAKFMKRPRRSVSVDGNRARFTHTRMSVNGGVDERRFISEPLISHTAAAAAACTSADVASTHSMNASTESINEEAASGRRSEQKQEINAAALRFLYWLNTADTIDETQRDASLKAFKEHYPHVYRLHNLRRRPQKSPSTASMPLAMPRRQLSEWAGASHAELLKFAAPLSAAAAAAADSTSIASSNEAAAAATPRATAAATTTRTRVPRASEADVNERLLAKMDSVISDEAGFAPAERTRILKFFRREYPHIYRLRFPEKHEPHQLMRKLYDLFPKLKEVR